MTLSMRHATWQQLSHEPRAAINAIVAIRRMHLIAKIKTHTHTHTRTWSKKQTAKHTKTKTNEHNKIWKQRSRRSRRTNTKSQSPRTTRGGEQDLTPPVPPPHKVATQMHVTRQSGEGRGPGCQRENPLESMRRQSCYARVRSPKVVKFYMERRTGAPCGGGTEERGEEGGAATHMCA